jgi:nitroreductase
MLIIREDEQKLPYMQDKDIAKCIKCGHCVAWCPKNASSIESLPAENYVKVTKAELPTTEQSKALLRSRRSVRRFKAKPVPRDLLEDILLTAANSPRAKNSPSVRFIVVDGREKMQRAGELICEHLDNVRKELPPKDKRKAFLAAKIRAFRGGNDILLRGAPQMVLAVTDKSYDWPEDGTVALTYIELAAYAEGVGCCWAGFLTHAARQYAPLQEFLGIAADEYLCGAQMIGWPIVAVPRRIPFGRRLDIQYIN